MVRGLPVQVRWQPRHPSRCRRQVSLTPHGRELVDTYEAQVNDRIHALTAVLTEAERTQLSRLATTLIGGRATI